MFKFVSPSPQTLYVCIWLYVSFLFPGWYTHFIGQGKSTSNFISIYKKPTVTVECFDCVFKMQNSTLLIGSIWAVLLFLLLFTDAYGKNIYFFIDFCSIFFSSFSFDCLVEVVLITFIIYINFIRKRIQLLLTQI